MKKEHDISHELPLVGKVKHLVFGGTHGIISIAALTTGIARASGNKLTILTTGVIALLTGAVTILSVEYLSAKSQKDLWDSVLEHEKEEFRHKPKHEIEEMRRYYLKSGFSKKETEMLIKSITRNESRWLEAHATHMFNIHPNKIGQPFKEAMELTKFHLIGGIIPILPYIFFSVHNALNYSILISLILLFALGTLRRSKAWLESGMEIILVASAAMAASYILGILAGAIIG